MREDSLLKIGAFTRVGRVSIATLRHYEKSGLLKPAALDPETGYRYYALDQLPRLNRILALKDLGFPLEQIARLLGESLSIEQLHGMFVLKQAQTQQMIAAEQARLARIASRLRHIEQEGVMPAYDVLLKQVDPLLVASIRELVPLGEPLGQPHAAILAYLDQQHVQQSHPALLILHSCYEWRDDGLWIDVETAIPVLAAVADNARVGTRTLPGGLMACCVHTGIDLLLGRAHTALHRWVAENGYRLSGPPRHVHLERAAHLDPSRYVTEMQFPVEKAISLDYS